MLEYKKCKQCKETKHFREFHFQMNKFKFDDLSSRCRACQRIERMISSAKGRAKSKGLPFNLVLADIVIPEFCPVLGIAIQHNKGTIRDNSPTIDRINNLRGYTRDNIVVVSLKANRLKNNATIEELIMIADFYKKYQKNERFYLTKLKNMVKRSR